MLIFTAQFIAFAPKMVMPQKDTCPPMKFSNHENVLYFLWMPQILIFIGFSFTNLRFNHKNPAEIISGVIIVND